MFTRTANVQAARCSGYRVATVKNISEVSLEVVNSPQIIFQRYREVVTADEAKAWFSIKPEMLKSESGS